MKTSRPAAAAALSGLRRVLVVEDNPILAATIEATLEDNGVEEVVLSPAVQASFEVIEAKRFDAIVLDVFLSDRSDGWALAELVQMLGPKPPRIVFQTGSPESIPADIAELGPVLEKPYDPEDLVAALAQPAPTGLLGKIKTAFS